MRTLPRAGLLAVSISLTASCGLGPTPNQERAREQAIQDCSAGTFDFTAMSDTQPLGRSDALYQKMIEATGNKQSVSMLDLTNSAGWSDEWDRMVGVWEDAERDELNSRAQTPGYCWKGLPSNSGMSDRPSDGFYLFIRDNEPVQFVRYRPDVYPIQLLPGAVVTKKTVLGMSGSKLQPE